MPQNIFEQPLGLPEKENLVLCGIQNELEAIKKVNSRRLRIKEYEKVLSQMKEINRKRKVSEILDILCYLEAKFQPMLFKDDFDWETERPKTMREAQELWKKYCELSKTLR